MKGYRTLGFKNKVRMEDTENTHEEEHSWWTEQMFARLKVVRCVVSLDGHFSRRPALPTKMSLGHEYVGHASILDRVATNT